MPVSEFWVARCPKCHHTTLVVAPMSKGPAEWNGAQPELYCPDCQTKYPIADLSKLFVRL